MKVLVAVSAPVVSLPEVGLAPDQPPEAIQLVALVDDQVSVEVPPEATVVGLALKETGGAGVAGVTVTVTD